MERFRSRAIAVAASLHAVGLLVSLALYLVGLQSYASHALVVSLVAFFVAAGLFRQKVTAARPVRR